MDSCFFDSVCNECGEAAIILISCLGESCGWREYVDLEHTICYNNSNHWNALTDGRVKYIFNAMDASEQLFNLTADPGELNDLSALPQFQVSALI